MSSSMGSAAPFALLFYFHKLIILLDFILSDIKKKKNKNQGKERDRGILEK